MMSRLLWTLPSRSTRPSWASSSNPICMHVTSFQQWLSQMSIGMPSTLQHHIFPLPISFGCLNMAAASSA
jgi:hypothetical protein